MKTLSGCILINRAVGASIIAMFSMNQGFQWFVTVRPDRSAAPWRGRIVSTTDSGHYGVWGGASNEAALDGRLQNIGKQRLYVFRGHNRRDRGSWKVTPDNYINDALVRGNWDDLPRPKTGKTMLQAVGRPVWPLLATTAQHLTRNGGRNCLKSQFRYTYPNGRQAKWGNAR